MRIFPTALLITCLAIAAWLSPSLPAAIVVAIVGIHFGTQGNALVAFRNFKALGRGLAEEVRSSAELEVSYSVGQLLNEAIGRRCYDHLKTVGTVTDTFKHWRQEVLDSATTTLGHAFDRETVTFQIRGNAGVEERRTALGGGDLPRTPHPARVIHRPAQRDVAQPGHRRGCASGFSCGADFCSCSLAVGKGCAPATMLARNGGGRGGKRSAAFRCCYP